VTDALHQGRAVDIRSFDGGEPPRDPSARWPFLIVPGYTPYIGWRGGLHPVCERRLELALDGLAKNLAPAVIVSGNAVHSPDNEAVLMHGWLRSHGVEARRIVVEPCARHTTTNLRNAGRILFRHGHSEALIVTSDARGLCRVAEQAFYLSRPWISSFYLRSLVELGYLVGKLRQIAPHHIVFRPSPRVVED
jgi:hypothetical protein